MTHMEETAVSKQEQGSLNAARLQEYLAHHEPAGTLPMHNGRVNKSRIADDLGFARSVWTQNPACRAVMAALEERLGSSPPEASGRPHGGSADRRVRELEQRVNRLEARAATLQAENAELREKLRMLGWVDENLPATGRLPW